jgi:hypothetical protein
MEWGTAILSAVLGGAVIQLLNTWKLWARLAVIEVRLGKIEDTLEQIGHFRVSRDTTLGGPR